MGEKTAVRTREKCGLNYFSLHRSATFAQPGTALFSHSIGLRCSDYSSYQFYKKIVGKNSQDTAHARIYDRLLELCTPIACTGPSMRKNIGQAKLNLLKTLLA